MKLFIGKEGYNPVDRIREQLAEAWGNTPEQDVSFPILSRTGRINPI
ncbi:MAG: hypothetical protein AAFW89_00620 [Bacteroidota bacterium]